MNYFVLMADMVKSKKYEKDIVLAQALIKKALNYLNKRFKEEIRAEARMSAGDQLQVLFTDPEAAFLYYRMLELLIYPLDIRASIGAGELYHERAWNTNEMYGEAYFNARKALEFCENQNKRILFYDEKEESFELNAMLSSRGFLNRWNSITTNCVEFIAELMYPLTMGDVYYKVRERELLKEIFLLKKEMHRAIIDKDGKESKGGLTSDREVSPYDTIEFKRIEQLSEGQEICNVKMAAKEDDIVLTSCWKKGFNVKIAEVIGISRQRVDRAMEQVNFAEKRNLDGAILLVLAREQRGRY